MKLSWQYKLIPTHEQQTEMSRWLDMLRCQYNWLLADRFDWWEMNRSPIDGCSLVQSIAPVRDPPNYYSQKKSLVPLKQERPWYKDIPSSRF